MFRKPLIFLLYICSASCTKLENRVDPAAYDCGVITGQAAQPILSMDLKPMNASELEVFLAKDDRTFEKADHLLSSKGCLLPEAKGDVFIRSRDRSLMQVVQNQSSIEPIILERAVLPPIAGLCPDLLYTQNQTIVFNQVVPSGFPSRFAGLLTTDVTLLDQDRILQEWKNLRVDELQRLSLASSTKLGRGSYVLQFLQKNYLLDSFDQQYSCKVRVDSSPLQVLLADAIQDKRRMADKDVFFVDPGYTLDFFVVQGFRDVAIEYCMQPVTFDELLQAPASPRACEKPLPFLETDGLPLQSGYHAVTYRARKGNIQTDWVTQYLGIRVPCSGTLKDGDLQTKALTPGAKNCTDLLANLVVDVPLTAASTLKLREITALTGDLTIKKQGSRNLQLNLNRINGSLSIATMEAKDLSMMGNLSFVLGGLNVSENSELESIAGLDHLKFAGSIRIEKNPNLGIISLPALETTSDAVLNQNKGDKISLPALQSVARLYISKNSDTETIDDLTSLKQARVLSFSGLKLRSLPALPQLQSLEFLQVGPAEVNEFPPLKVTTIKSLLLSGLKDFDFATLQFKTVEQELYLTQMNSLKNLAFLKSVALSENAYVVIEENAQIESLAGLEHVKALGSLFIRKNPVLENVSGLNQLTSAGEISIVDNLSLRRIKDFDALQSLKILNIQNNPLLESIEGFPVVRDLGSVNIRSDKDLTISGFDRAESMEQLVILRASEGANSSLDLQALQSVKDLKLSLILDIPLIESSKPLKTLNFIGGKFGARVTGDCVPHAFQSLKSLARNSVKDTDLSLERDSGLLSALSKVFGNSYASVQALPASFIYRNSRSGEEAGYRLLETVCPASE